MTIYLCVTQILQHNYLLFAIFSFFVDLQDESVIASPTACSPEATPTAEYAGNSIISTTETIFYKQVFLVGTFADRTHRVMFRPPRPNCNVYTKDVWNSLCALQSYDTSTDPSTVNNAALRLAQCAYMLYKHDATGELPLAVLDALKDLDLSAEPKRVSYKPPHPMDSVEYAKTFDLGKLKHYTFAVTRMPLLVQIVFFNRPLSHDAHESAEIWRGNAYINCAISPQLISVLTHTHTQH